MNYISSALFEQFHSNGSWRKSVLQRVRQEEDFTLRLLEGKEKQKTEAIQKTEEGKGTQKRQETNEISPLTPQDITEIFGTRRETQEPKKTGYTASVVYPFEQRVSAGQRTQSNALARETNDPIVAFRNFTGRGGLHGISFSDHQNFHAYTEAKKELEQGQFFTPQSICQLIVEMLEIEPHKKVADICCGMGQFFNFLKESECFGIEIDPEAIAISRKLYPKAKVSCVDMRAFKNFPEGKMDYIVGNPPFNLTLEGNAFSRELTSQSGKIQSQELYLLLAEKNLLEGGFLAFVCPSSFLRDTLKHEKVNRFLDAHFERVAEIELPRNAFRQYGVKDFATKILIFQKKAKGVCLENTSFFLSSEMENPLEHWRKSGNCQIFKRHKALAFQEQMRNRFRVYLEERRAEEEKREEERKITKLFYDLRCLSPEISASLKTEYEKAKAEEGKAEKPFCMSYAEWMKVRPNPQRVVKKAQRVLREYQSPKREKGDIVRICKSKGKIFLKASTRKARQALLSRTKKTEWEINKLLNKKMWTQEWESFVSVISSLYQEPLYSETKKERTLIPFKNFSVKSFLLRKSRKVAQWKTPIENR